MEQVNLNIPVIVRHIKLDYKIQGELVRLRGNLDYSKGFITGRKLEVAKNKLVAVTSKW